MATTEEKLSLASRAFRGQSSEQEIVTALDDVMGQLQEVRTAARYLAADHLHGERADNMRRSEGIMYGADAALGIARSVLDRDDDEPADEDGEA